SKRLFFHPALPPTSATGILCKNGLDFLKRIPDPRTDDSNQSLKCAPAAGLSNFLHSFLKRSYVTSYRTAPTSKASRPHHLRFRFEHEALWLPKYFPSKSAIRGNKE